LKSAQSLEADSSKVDLYSEDSGAGKSLDDVLARSDIGAVIIALPIKNQPEYIRKALLAGKHVLSEKPVAENVKEAVELIKWYRAEIVGKGVTWAVAENQRYLASFIRAAEAVQTLGRQLTFRTRMQVLVSGGKYFETS
jgi:predicted dehydrogenase